MYIKVKEDSLIWEFIRVHAETYVQQTVDFLTESIKNKLLKKTCDYIGNIFSETQNLSAKEVRLICSEEIRSQMITDNRQNPFNMFYIVNGEIKKVGDKIIAYQIKYIVEKGLIDN